MSQADPPSIGGPAAEPVVEAPDLFVEPHSCQAQVTRVGNEGPAIVRIQSGMTFESAGHGDHLDSLGPERRCCSGEMRGGGDEHDTGPLLTGGHWGEVDGFFAGRGAGVDDADPDVCRNASFQPGPERLAVMDPGFRYRVDSPAENEVGGNAPVDQGEAGGDPVKGGVDLEAGWLSLARRVATSQNDDGIGPGWERCHRGGMFESGEKPGGEGRAAEEGEEQARGSGDAGQPAVRSSQQHNGDGDPQEPTPAEGILKGLEQREGCLSADGADFHHREHREHRGGKRALLTTTVATVAKEAGGSGGASVLTSRVGVPSFKIQV